MQSSRSRVAASANVTSAASSPAVGVAVAGRRACRRSRRRRTDVVGRDQHPAGRPRRPGRRARSPPAPPGRRPARATRRPRSGRRAATSSPRCGSWPRWMSSNRPAPSCTTAPTHGTTCGDVPEVGSSGTMRGRLRSPYPLPRRTHSAQSTGSAPLDDSGPVTGRCCPMSVSPVCPRCGEQLVVRPGSAAQAWCHVHGAVTPLHHAVLLAHDAIVGRHRRRPGACLGARPHAVRLGGHRPGLGR